MTPGNPVEPLKHMVNFRLKLKAAANWDGRDILVLPNPAIPVTPPARPSRRKVELQMNRKLGTERALVELKPLVEETETRSEVTSPPEDSWMMVFRAERLQV